MDSFKIALHSVTDRITNSSTVIYTYSDASKEACEKMIDTLLEAIGSGKRCIDVFSLSVDVDEDTLVDCLDDYVRTHKEDLEGLPAGISKRGYGTRVSSINGLLDSIKLGADKPAWMKDAGRFLSDGTRAQTFLTVTPLKPEYEKAGKAIRAFLYSTESEDVFR